MRRYNVCGSACNKEGSSSMISTLGTSIQYHPIYLYFSHVSLRLNSFAVSTPVLSAGESGFLSAIMHYQAGMVLRGYLISISIPCSRLRRSRREYRVCGKKCAARIFFHTPCTSRGGFAAQRPIRELERCGACLRVVRGEVEIWAMPVFSHALYLQRRLRRLKADQRAGALRRLPPRCTGRSGNMGSARFFPHPVPRRRLRCTKAGERGRERCGACLRVVGWGGRMRCAHSPSPPYNPGAAEPRERRARECGALRIRHPLKGRRTMKAVLCKAYGPPEDLVLDRK